MSSSVYSRLNGVFAKTPKPTSAAVAAVAGASNTKPDTAKPSAAARKISEIVRNFKKNSRSVNFRRNISAYEAAVRRLAARKDFSAVESIIEHQKKYKDSITDEGFAVRLITLYGKAKMFDHSRKLFDELPSLECDRTVMSFNALLAACVYSKKYDKISEIFKEIPETLSIEPDTVSYNTVIKAFCEMGSLDSALTVMNEMEKNGIEPDLITYNTVLEAFYQSKKFSEADKLWGSMEEKNVVANVRSYNAKLRGLVSNEQVSEAVKLLDEMEENGVKPDTFSYNAVIKGLTENDNLEDAKSLLKKMEESDCVPDHVTFSMLIKFAHDKDDIDYALELCKKVLGLKRYIYRELMQMVVDGLVKMSRMEEARELVEVVGSTSTINYNLKMANTK